MSCTGEPCAASAGQPVAIRVGKGNDRSWGKPPAAMHLAKSSLCKASAVDVAPMTEPHDKDPNLAIVDLGNDSVVADTVLPELPQFITF